MLHQHQNIQLIRLPLLKETAVPYSAFKKAGFEVIFATEKGVKPCCDEKLLKGITQKLLVRSLYPTHQAHKRRLKPLYIHVISRIAIWLFNQGATKEVCNLYNDMTLTPEFQTPIPWSSPTFNLSPYTLIFLPGGHEKGVRQLIDSPIIQQHLATYFPQTYKPSKLTVAAICHGVQALSKATLPNGKSVIHECDTTALPGAFEGVAYQGTRLFMGDYYKTYGKDADSVEVAVKKCLDEPARQFKSSLGPSP